MHRTVDSYAQYFNNRCIREILEPVRAFEALAHETRLAVFRLLIPVGQNGLAAGSISERLGLAANNLSFHLGRLANTGLVRGRRQGRHLYYAVDYARLAELVDFFADDCCAAAPEGCLPDCPSAAPKPGRGSRAGRERLGSTTPNRR